MQFIRSIIPIIAVIKVSAFSFSPKRTVNRNLFVRVNEGSNLFPATVVSKLNYRYLDRNDEDASFSSLRTRAPPTFQKEEVHAKTPGGINKPLLLSLFFNQFVILVISLALSGAYVYGLGNQQFLNEGIFNWSGLEDAPSAELSLEMLNPTSIGFGVLGSIPIILISNALDKSADRKFALTNFSTIFMTMTLFGRRTDVSQVDQELTKTDKMRPFIRTLNVAVLAATISLTTGIVEELVFRGLVPHFLESALFNDQILLAYFGQALLFAAGHTSPRVSMEENKTLGSIHLINGLWSGLLYLLSGGDLVPCVISHSLYDFQVFFSTWMKTNDQIEYATKMSLEPTPKDSLAEMQALKRALGAKQFPDPSLKLAKRVFYLFDEDKNRYISRSEAQRGISYLGIEGFLVPPPTAVVDNLYDSCISERKQKGVMLPNHVSDQLRFSDFVRIVLNAKAVGANVFEAGQQGKSSSTNRLAK
jgi:membrane protease YdiL (CAAX protease family)